MTILSVLGRQLDDYMENVVRKTFAGCLFVAEGIVYSIIQELSMGFYIASSLMFLTIRPSSWLAPRTKLILGQSFCHS